MDICYTVNVAKTGLIMNMLDVEGSFYSASM